MMDDEELATLVDSYAQSALNRDGEELSSRRQRLLKAYRGESPDTPKKNRSSWVARDVYETIEWAMPSIIRAFRSSHRAVEFNPRTIDDVEPAAQETDTVNYTIFERNDGFMAMFAWIKETLMSPNAYVKKYLEEKVCIEEEPYTSMTEAAIAQILSGAGPNTEIQVIEQSDAGPIALPVPAQDPNTGQPIIQMVEVPSYDIRIRRVTRERRPRLLNVPPEQILVANDWDKLDLDEAPFVGHIDCKTREELIALGVNEADLDDISSEEEMGRTYGAEREVRSDSTDEDPVMARLMPRYDESLKKYWVLESYVRTDYDGDGYAELRKVLTCGKTVLSNEITSYMPIIAMTSVPMPHRHVGMSLAESVEDLQNLRTVLMRQTLNNLYNINTRRTFIDENAAADDGSTWNDIGNPAATHIKVKGPPGQSVMPEQLQGVLGETAPLLEMVSNLRRIRTGVSPETSLDPDILRETTAHAFASAQDAASQRIETIVRIMAETGIKKLFLKTHQLLRMHADQPLVLELRGKWVEVNPADWRERTDVRVSVGLGYNGTQQTVAALTQTLAQQQALAAMGLATPGRIYNTLEKLTTALNIGHAPQFFVDPRSMEYQPPQPKPDPVLIQAQAYMKEVEAGAQNKATELQANAAKAQSEAGLAAKKLELETARMEIELQLKEIELQGKTHMDAHKASLEVEEKQAQITLFGAQAMREQEQSLYFHALAEKAIVEANNSRTALPSEVKLNEAKAASEEKKAEEPAEEKTDNA